MVGTLLLAGIAIGALTASLTGLIAFASDDRELRDLTLWLMGSLGGSNWPKVLAVLQFAILVANHHAAVDPWPKRLPAWRGRGFSSRHRR
jgi:ABC-type Fe3+-siderophore transport system permease subunit